MNPRFPLTAKILTWFSLNLLLLMLIAWLGLRYSTSSGFDSFLSGHVGGRVESTARAIMGELETNPRTEWNGILARYGQVHGVKFLVLGTELETLAGEEVDLPETLRAQLPRPPRGGEGFGPNRRGPPTGEAGGGNEFGPRGEPGGEGRGFPPPGRKGPGGKKRPPPGGLDNQPASEDSRRPPVEGGWTEAPAPDSTAHTGPAGKEKQEPPGTAPIHRRFLVQSENPRAYWVGLMGALRPGTGPGGHMRCTLLARSTTFSAGGFFFDYRPWILSIVGIVVLCGLFWLPFIGGITRSIAQLTRATRQIADGQFDVRVDEKRTDELGQLGGAINRMSTRLEGFVTGQKRSLGDIAHELCSPLSRLQISVGILEQHSSEQQKQCIEDVQEEVQHMSDLVNELLTISKASLKPGNIKRQQVGVKAIADAAAKREAANKDEVVVEVPADLFCFASPELLQRALSNLVRNALRYAGDAGPITITARREGSSAVITITDLGPGVPPAHLDRIFDAFYRIEPDRARNTGGAGLGLAIVKTCIEACGGTATAKNREPRGLEVKLTLPMQ
ncbi:MAG: HAMP domain-containing histidine kinase [Verrucomicrobia bacterium]|nr:HAMP domain-containing histidine kinase [Verrucomicrobiota bacterium]